MRKKRNAEAVCLITPSLIHLRQFSHSLGNKSIKDVYSLLVRSMVKIHRGKNNNNNNDINDDVAWLMNGNHSINLLLVNPKMIC